MNAIAAIPEVAALDSRQSLIRIPGEQDIPVTGRIRRLIDSPPFQRLARIRQLGLVTLVYPGASHSRFEHCLGVYRNVLLFLRRLGAVDEFTDLVSGDDAESLIVAALLHDLGHWPYCHPLEDMRLDAIPEHEALAVTRMERTEIAEILQQEFGKRPEQIARVLVGPCQTPADQLRHSLLSGPIDVDKMDYLYRDSLHAGVPYGMHFDRQRLIGALCVDGQNCRLAITEKGCTAAELMVFARYIMFSEVYWHHAVRSATAMLQRVVFELREQLDLVRLFESDDAGFVRQLQAAGRQTACGPMLDGLFGERRSLYKRVAQFTISQDRDVYARVSRQPYPWLVETGARVVECLRPACGRDISPLDVLIDAPPQGLEIQFRIPVRYDQPRRFRWLEEVSPVVKTLATRQFDDYVKRIRVFIHPRLVDSVRQIPDLRQRLVAAVADHR